ncbi:hypothetical protein D0T53_12030 [Dysgonomonas sp. 216]|uniref:hypothetical protein n=1 Tax=Dysgonomonas sp. 216 TaxID=2302934 RepID=UPI0013D1D6E5|nr:hypothetical protein [Dysgonomonas sp. 216]NDW19635.1 hypothetical protein [Dysgonomonas sp. 216]
MKDGNSEIGDYDFGSDDAYKTNMQDGVEDKLNSAFNGFVQKDENITEAVVAEPLSAESLDTTLERVEEIDSAYEDKNFAGAILGGIIGTVVGALIWTLITVITNYKIGYAAIGVGLLVGFLVYRMGKGKSFMFGIIGGLFALIACVVGDFFSVVAIMANELEMSYFSYLTGHGFADSIDIMKAWFEPLDLLFYGIAAYAGFKLSFKD